MTKCKICGVDYVTSGPVLGVDLCSLCLTRHQDVLCDVWNTAIASFAKLSETIDGIDAKGKRELQSLATIARVRVTKGKDQMSTFDYGGKLPDGQHERHPSLPEAERQQKVRPVRQTYRHVGRRPKHPTRPLTPEEQVRYAREGYELFEIYPEDRAPVTGSFWTKKQLNSGCNTTTRMGSALAETWAAKPDYYGATFCSHCGDYFPVAEFVWIEASGQDGPVLGT